MIGAARDLRGTARDMVRDLRDTFSDRDEVLDRAALLSHKLPQIVEGLKVIGKSDKSELFSIGSFLEANARERANEPAIYFEDRMYTHHELDEQATRWANLLASRGVKKGDAVAILMENRPELLFAVGGVVKLGAIAGVINTNQRKDVLLHSLKLCESKAFAIGEELFQTFTEVRADLENASNSCVFFVPDRDARADDERGAASCPPDAVYAPQALREASTYSPLERARVSLGDPCFYIFTSGTTGLPKAAVMSHMRWAKASAAFGKVAMHMLPEDTLYVSLPLYHNNALTVAWSSVAGAGAAMAIRRKFSASQFWDDVRRYGCTSFVYIGELCRYLMNQPPKPYDKINPVTKIVGNGLRPDIWKAFKERFDINEVYEFYAASEGNIAFVNLLNANCTVGLCPAPYAIVEYDIDNDEPVRDRDGFMKRVPRGGTGLLLGEVSKKYDFDGYTDKSASEKKLFRNVFQQGDVWFNSGDLLRDQGFHHAQFVDRVGDTFRWKSENVSTNEVAEVMNQFEQIGESTVVGVEVPNCEGRAGLSAFVLNLPAEHFDPSGLASWLRDRLPAYAIPLFIRIQPSLEVTGTFKQKKGDLRKEGFDLAVVSDPLYVLLPRASEYVRLTPELHREILDGKIAF